MKAVVLLALIGLASCNLINLQDIDRDFRIKYSYDDDYDREVEFDFNDRPRTVFRQVAAPIAQYRTAPRVEFRTSSVAAQTAPVQIVASHTPVFTQRQVVPVAAPQPPVFVQERVVPVPQTNVVTRYVQAQSAPVARTVVQAAPVARTVVHAAPVARTVVQAAPVVRSVVPAVPAPAPAPFVVTHARPTFVTERRRFVSKSSDDNDSDEE